MAKILMVVNLKRQKLGRRCLLNHDLYKKYYGHILLLVWKQTFPTTLYVTCEIKQQ